MLTLVNPPGIKTFSGLNMHTPNPPLGLAYMAGALRKADIDFSVIDAVREDLDTVRPFQTRADLMVQGLHPTEVVDRRPIINNPATNPAHNYSGLNLIVSPAPVFI